MAQSHWLDPLARYLLKMSGHLPVQGNKGSHKFMPEVKGIEIELSKLKKKVLGQTPASSVAIDINRASAEELRQLKGCSEEMIGLLLRLQKGGVQLTGLEDLVKVLNIPKALGESWAPNLIFRWYGSGPIPEETELININSASLNVLQKNLGWSEPRLIRLLKSRQKKPFENLADLQERLALTPGTIEKLIGIVSFEQKQAQSILLPKNLY